MGTPDRLSVERGGPAQVCNYHGEFSSEGEVRREVAGDSGSLSKRDGPEQELVL